MKIGKKLKFLLAAGLICISTISMAGCNNSANETDKKDTQTEQKSEDNKEKDNTTSSATQEEDEKETSSKDKKADKDIVYYTYDINTEKLTEHTKKYDEISVANVIDALVSSNVLQKGTEVKTAKVEEVDSVRTLIVDVNDKFVNFNQGSTQESLQLQCFTNSLIKTFKVKQVLLTVEGNPYSGGHIALNKGEMLKFK